MKQGAIALFEGVAALPRGDLLTVIYGRDARADRTRWLFERAEEHARSTRASIVVLMFVPSTSKAPDPETRAIQAAGYERLGSRLRHVVTVPEGPAFHTSIVRLVMTAHIMLTHNRAVHRIVDSAAVGIQSVRDVASPATPSAASMVADVAALRSALTRTHAAAHIAT